MSDTSTASAFMAALVDALLLRPALEGMQITSAPMGEYSALESIQLDDAVAPQEAAQLGNQRRREDYTVNGEIWIVKPGADEPVIREARDRAYAIAGEIERALRDDPAMGATVHVAQYAGADLAQGIHPDGRWAQLDFRIAVTAYVTKT